METRYIPGLGLLVGVFSLSEIEANKDREEVEAMKVKTGLQYTNQEFLFENGVPVGLKVYLCSLSDMRA